MMHAFQSQVGLFQAANEKSILPKDDTKLLNHDFVGHINQRSTIICLAFLKVSISHLKLCECDLWQKLDLSWCDQALIFPNTSPTTSAVNPLDPNSPYPGLNAGDFVDLGEFSRIK